MSINFANVKAITIPQGSVKSITSGGITLWEVAPTTTTYRLLDYIKFSGNEYILTDHKPTNNRYYYLNFEIAAKTNDRFIFAAGGDATTDGAMRCTVRTSASYFQRRYGRNSSSNTNIGTTCNINTFYQLRFRIFDDFQAYFAIADSGGTVLGYSNATAVTFTPANMNTFGIMCYGQGTYGSNFSQGKVYRYYYRIGDASGDLGCNAYPVQRKSDGRCGLYDTVTNTFYPMEGAQITWSAAGSTVTEEWTPGGYSPAPTPTGTIIPQADWSDNTYSHFYYVTANNAFYTALNTAAPGSNVRVRVTASVYNPTEDKTYTSSTVNTLTWESDTNQWINSIFYVALQYSTSSNATIPTFIIRNGGTAGQTSNTTQFNGTGMSELYNTYGCNFVGNVILEYLGTV